MYHHLNVTTIITAVVDDNGDEDDNDDELPTTSAGLALPVAGDNEMPEAYFFPGFVAFVLFGPFVMKKRTNPSCFRQRTVLTTLEKRHQLVVLHQQKEKQTMRGLQAGQAE